MICDNVIIVILINVFHYNVQCKVVRDTASDNGPIIVTNIGTIKGLRATDGDYDMFMGIPYATVNKSNVFGAAIPHPPFKEPFEAYDDSAICPQQEEFNLTITGSLDCLHLNIYVPNTGVTNLPVMVYIYGGKFKFGFAGRFLYGPQYLVRYNVILVTLNYRVGPYGFMCLDKREVPGNAGLKDQVLALKWIQDHIQSFGGDPNQVTLFGSSAGAMCCGFHLLSDYERNYNNIILQSGSAFNSGIVLEPNTTVPLKLAESLGFSTDDVDEALSFLSDKDVHEVINASLDMKFGPCLEKRFPNIKKFNPTSAMNSNHSKVAGIAVLLGTNSDESLIDYPEETGPEQLQLWGSLFERNFIDTFNFNETLLKGAVESVRLFYLGDDDIDINIRGQMLNYSGDFSIVYPTFRSVAPYLNAGAEKVYQYVFSYDGKHNFVKYRVNFTQPGVSHADELGYLYKMEFIPEEPTLEDQLIIDRMTLMWTNFAKYRDPTPETNVLLPVKWIPITTGSPYYYLNINTEMSVGRRYAHDRMAFWDLFYKTYAKYEKGFVMQEAKDLTKSVLSSSTITSFSKVFLSCVIFITFL